MVKSKDDTIRARLALFHHLLSDLVTSLCLCVLIRKREKMLVPYLRVYCENGVIAQVFRRVLGTVTLRMFSKKKAEVNTIFSRAFIHLGR